MGRFAKAHDVVVISATVKAEMFGTASAAMACNSGASSKLNREKADAVPAKPWGCNSLRLARDAEEID
jgi:hypothetical protein